jgi:spore coat protein A
MANRRQFLKTCAMASAGALLLRGKAWSFNHSPSGVTKFVTTLPGLGPSGANSLGNYIPVLSPNTTKFRGTDYYEIVAKEFKQQVHPGIPATTFWGYADATTLDSKYLGGVIVAKRNRPVKLKVTNQLPGSHILPVDPTLVDPAMGGETGGRTDRMCIHLHGGLIRWDMDGGPFNWFSNPANAGGFVHGSSFINGAEPGAAIYDYPNTQSARTIWYHDHAYSLTRINAFAGMATGYLITDEAETLLVNSGVLPNFPGYPLGVPLVVQDKSFFDPASDPSYPVTSAVKGSLWYPWKYDPARWELTGSPPPISTVPEYFSDIILVNGAPYPKFGPLPPRRMRFRFLNGSQARFYNLQLYVDDGISPDGINLDPLTRAPKNEPGPAFIQIGNEAGFLPSPAVFSADGTNKNSNNVMAYKLTGDTGDPTIGNAIGYNLLMAPAERPDVIVDFRGFEGKNLILYNDAPAPFPGGDDFYDNRTPNDGPDTRILMRFEIGTSGAIKELSFHQTVNALKAALPVTFLVTQPSTLIKPDGPAQVKTLNEDFDEFGRLRQLVGAPEPMVYLDGPTEVAHRGEVQRWQIYNLTGDTHPMHFHLVNVAIRKREQWAFNADGTPVLPLRPIPGTARPADANERGWKETVRMNPGEVITVDMKFDMPLGAPPSPRLAAMGIHNAAEYVWHCHILEHEEHDMMRPLVVRG